VPYPRSQPNEPPSGTKIAVKAVGLSHSSRARKNRQKIKGKNREKSKMEESKSEASPIMQAAAAAAP